MNINVETIKKINMPDKSFQNFIDNYKDFDGTLEDYLKLNKISYNDKIFVFSELAKEKHKMKFVLSCGIFVLPLFERKYPNDTKHFIALEKLAQCISDCNEENRKDLYLAQWDAHLLSIYACKNMANLHEEYLNDNTDNIEAKYFDYLSAKVAFQAVRAIAEGVIAGYCPDESNLAVKRANSQTILAKRYEGILMASINGATPSEVQKAAKEAEKEQEKMNVSFMIKALA
jgi:hypothetical protein